MYVVTWKLALLLYAVFNAGGTICWIASRRAEDRFWPRRGERLSELANLAYSLVGFPFVVVLEFCVVPLWMRARRSRPTRELNAEVPKPPTVVPVASYSTVVPIGGANDVRKKKRRRKRHRRF